MADSLPSVVAARAIDLINDRPRYLTKSRFKLAVECPTKLYYKGKKDIYADTMVGDDFLEALADGGFQVGELAKLMFPNGHEIASGSHQAQIDETRQLLERDNVTLFEAAIFHEGLFALVDVLRKTGNRIELIEVKAKSFDSGDQYAFRRLHGGISPDMLPYLQDVAFQRYVLGLAFPRFEVNSFLMLVDKSKVCTVDGLNQRFKIQRKNNRCKIVKAPGTNSTSIGAHILKQEPVDEYVDEILRAPISAPGVAMRLPELAREWSEKYAADIRIEPSIGPQCAGCEFRTAGDSSSLRSGFRECWQSAAGFTDADFAQGSVLDIWNFRSKKKLLDSGIRKLSDIKDKGVLNYAEAEDGLSTSQRQWMQVSGEWSGGRDFYLDTALMKREMSSWRFPLHFIDFETARVAIPFFSGQHPYANVAFQFSHHVVESSGEVTHRNQFLSATPGVSPNYAFVRSLKSALGEAGTVFMWSPHENTTLNAVLSELEGDANRPANAAELMTFIRSVTIKKDGSRVVRKGSRAMVDLCRLAERAFFHPSTNGSCSIKKVLPAVLQSSEYLKRRYSHPIYGAPGGIQSLNFVEHPQIWWRESEGKVDDPYALLPQVFADLPPEFRTTLAYAEATEIAQGGAATMAYARLQFEDLQPTVRKSIEAALLRYCELDTLAMVMVYEAWREWINE